MTETLTPAAELSGARQDRIDGKLGEREFHATMERLGPLLDQSPVAPVVDPGMAAEAISQLKQRRIAGEIGEWDYHRQLAQLAPLTTGETPAPVDLVDPFDRQIAEQMQPAAPQDYQFDYGTGAPLDDGSLAFDTELRATLSEAGVPRHLGGPIRNSMAEIGERLASASAAERAAQMDRTASILRQQWGAETDARVKTVENFIIESVIKHPELDQLLGREPWHLADPKIWIYLWTTSEHRAMRKT